MTDVTTEPGSPDGPAAPAPEPAAPRVGDDGGGFSLRAVGSSAALLTIATLAGQLFTTGRELFVAGRVGTSGGLDGLLVALVVPTIVSSVLASGTAAAVVPAHAEIARRAGIGAARAFLSAVFVALVVVATAVMAILLALPGLAVAVAGPGLDADGIRSALDAVPLLAPIGILSVAAGMLATMCQIEGRFRIVALAWLLGPVASLAVTIGLWESAGLAAFALALSAHFAVGCAVLLPYVVATGLLPLPRLPSGHGEIRRFATHALPLTVSAFVNELRLVADRAVTSLLATGSVSALRYGQTLVLAPTQALAPGWTLVVYPALVRESLSDREGGLGEAVEVSCRYVIALFTPIAVGAIALAPIVVDLVYRRGAFDAGAAIATTAVVAGLAPMFVLVLLMSVLAPAHNALRHGGLLLAMGFLGAVLNLVLNLALGQAVGVGGIAASTSITYAILIAILAWRLTADQPAFRPGALGRTAVTAILASLVPALPVGWFAWTRPPSGSIVVDLALIVALSAVGAVGYVLAAGRLGRPEPGQLVGAGWAAIRRRTSPAGAR
jgi:putative peptidoglycan lipid II flippase